MDQHIGSPTDGGTATDPPGSDSASARIIGQIQLQKTGFASAWFARQATGTSPGGDTGGTNVTCESFGVCSACVIASSPSPDLASAPPDLGHWDASSPDFASVDLTPKDLSPDLMPAPQQLNAGAIFVTGTTPPFQLDVDSNGVYATYTQATPLWAIGATVEVSSLGEPPVPAFTVTLAPPDATPLTSAPSLMKRTADYAIAWPATEGALFVAISAYRSLGGATATVSCRFDRALGQGTIPKAALGKLPSTTSGDYAAWVTFSSIASRTVTAGDADIIVEAWAPITAPTPSDGFSIE